jgi:ubiquinone/menaquinone biosynthesis C-methylase UbiE
MMSVSSHLKIDLQEYDSRIRTFVPDYERMLDAAAGALRALEGSRPHIVELGIGTAALAARCLASVPKARLTGIDSDPAILDQAARRLTPYRRRVTLVPGDFARMSLPQCDAVIASLSLHHLRTSAEKQRLYRRTARALRPGGLLINADAALPDDATLAALALKEWQRHLRQTYTAAETRTYFRAWSGEDKYFTLTEELTMLRRASLTPEVVWRSGIDVVIAARRPRAYGAR